MELPDAAQHYRDARDEYERCRQLSDAARTEYTYGDGTMRNWEAANLAACNARRHRDAARDLLTVAALAHVDNGCAR